MKILLCNESYIGDLILSTSILPVIKKVMPHCQIGFLTGSWARSVVDNHSLIDWVHVHDQVFQNRHSLSKKEKKKQELETRAQALQEMTAIGYDAAIDLHSYYKTNSSYLLYKAKIPERIAYWNCPQPFFYTQLLHWECKYLHTLENHRMMMLHLGISKKELENATSYLEYKGQIPKNPHVHNLPNKYFVIHSGSGHPNKDWNTDSWEIVTSEMDKWGYPLVFIGKGYREKKRIAHLKSRLKHAIDLCDCLSFRDLMFVIQNAKFLIGMDSMGGHLAAHFGIPALLLFTGEPIVSDFRPYHPFCHTIKPDPKYWYAWDELYPKKPVDMICPQAVLHKVKKILTAHAIVYSVLN